MACLTWSYPIIYIRMVVWEKKEKKKKSFLTHRATLEKDNKSSKAYNIYRVINPCNAYKVIKFHKKYLYMIYL